MTIYLWIVVGFLSAVMFGLGCIFARARLKTRGHEKILPDNHANLALGVFFTLIAIGVAVDTVYLQVNFNRFVKGQVDCNTKALDSGNKIQLQREVVDHASAEFDIALQQYITVAATKSVVKADDSAFTHLEDALDHVTSARLDMVKVYADNPVIQC